MLTDKLPTKLEAAKALTRSLDKSLALEWLWPDVFDKGRPRSYWFGPVATNGVPYVRPDQPMHLKHEYHVTDGAGTKKMFGYEEVPEILGGGLNKIYYRRVANVTDS